MTTQQEIFEIAHKELGVKETAGEIHTPRVLEYLSTVGMNASDETPWCSAFINWCVQQAGVRGTRSAAARSWLEWGCAIPEAMARPGDVVVLWRESRYSWKGHVGFLVHMGKDSVELLGGNQANSVSTKWYDKRRVIDIRRYDAESDSD